MNLTRVLILLLALVLLAGGAYWLLGGAARGADTVVLVSVSGLRADALAAMPTLSALAGEGASGVLQASIPLAAGGAAELVTGRDPIAAESLFGDLALLPPGLPTLATRFGDEGYASIALVGDGRLSLLSGLYRGFEAVALPSSPFDQPIIPDESARIRAPRSGHLPGPLVVQLFAQRIQSLDARARLFAWIHLSDPSQALVTAEATGAADEAYAEALGRVDEALAALLETLERAGRREGALIVVSSLHGESLGDSGELRHGIFSDDATTRVPVVAAGAGPTPLPGQLRALGDFILEARGGEGLGSRRDGPTWRGSWVGTRSYGWAPRVEILEGGDWRRARPGEVALPEAMRLEGERVDEEVAAETLRAMRAAHEAALAGEGEAALAGLAELRARLPEAMAPRRLALSLLRPSRQPLAQESIAMRAEILQEVEAIAGESPLRRLDLARALAEAGERQRALDVVLALGRDPTLTAGQRWALAELLASLDALEAAVDTAAGVADAYAVDEVPELWEWIGDKLARSGNAFRARAAYEKAETVERARSANLAAKRGDALQALGENEEALRAYAEAIRRDPTYRYPHLRAGELFVELERFNEAAHALASSVPSSGRVADDALARARVLEQRGLVRAAAGELYEAAQEAGGDPRLQVGLGRLLVTAGEPERAEEFLNNVLSANPDAPAALVQLARVRAAQGRVDETLALLERLEPRCGREGALAVRSDPLFVGSTADPRLASVARGFALERFPAAGAAPGGPG